MKEQPILFSGPMVRAIIEDRKSQTRRVMKKQPASVEWWLNGQPSDRVSGIPVMRDDRGHGWSSCGPFKCPYGHPGDRLWVRETFRLFDSSVECACYDDCKCSKHHGKPLFKADCDDDGPWKPSIHMPRSISRITLEVTDVRVERLNSITEEDAKAEGILPNQRAPLDSTSRICTNCGRHIHQHIGSVDVCPQSHGDTFTNWTTKGGFKILWESINGPGSWDLNPWVWAITFKRI